MPRLVLFLAALMASANLQDAEAVNATSVDVGVMMRLHGNVGNELGDQFKQNVACALMAQYHINNRVSTLVPEANQLLPQGFVLSTDLRDSWSSPSVAVESAIHWNSQGRHAIVGTFRSAVSGPLVSSHSLSEHFFCAVWS